MSNQTSDLPSADQLRALASEIENPSKHGNAAGIEQIVNALNDINETLKNLYERTLDTIIKTQVTLGTMQADIARILSDKQINLSVVANKEINKSDPWSASGSESRSPEFAYSAPFGDEDYKWRGGPRYHTPRY